MRRELTIAVLLLGMCFQLPVLAAANEPFPVSSGTTLLAARDNPKPHSGQQRFTSRLGSKDAASAVKRQFRSSKILSVNLIESKGPPVYRVKTLSEKGVVKFVYVDGQTGDVFE